ncbi:MAG TPA: Nif3-like dinuclear metal center hexameric protein [Anaerolineales bacterium]|nr:Nif3-like dinuclear metal center hexameric protein [Anaerolineales bacterium]
MDNQILYGIFNPETLDAQLDEWGMRIHCREPDAIGYATTLTPATIKQARANHINLLVTHHDAWDFLLEERNMCLELLDQYQISHVWCHAPLDAADFGTAAALLDALGCKPIGTIAEGDGRVGELASPAQLADIIKWLEQQLQENPCRIAAAERPISRIACVTGAGASINYLTEALAFDADLYITGETNLYLLEYASFRKVNLLVYSHNYTEMPGTRNLAERIASRLGIKTVLRLDEPHY